MKFKLSIISFLIIQLSCSTPSQFILTSPNGLLQINVLNEGNTSLFTATYKGDTILKQSVLGLRPVRSH